MTADSGAAEAARKRSRKAACRRMPRNIQPPNPPREERFRARMSERTTEIPEVGPYSLEARGHAAMAVHGGSQPLASRPNAISSRRPEATERFHGPRKSIAERFP